MTSLTNNNQTDEASVLIFDTIDRIIASPTASHCWNQLLKLLQIYRHPSNIANVENALFGKIPVSGLASFYRGMVFVLLTSEARYLEMAGRALHGLRPIDPDRIAAFVHVCWQISLRDATNRIDFTTLWNFACIPECLALLDTLEDHVATDSPVIAPKSPQIKRITIIAPQLINLAHPPTRMVLEQAAILLQLGIGVSIFSCQEELVPDLGPLLGCEEDMAPPALNVAGWEKYLSQDVDIRNSDSRFSLRRRWHDMRTLVKAAQPDLVLFVGLQSGLIRLLAKEFPILALGTNSVKPLVPCDVWLCSDDMLCNKLNSTLTQSAAWFHPYRINRRTPLFPSSRAELGIGIHAIVFITLVGRFNTIRAEWAQRMVTVLHQHPNVVWHVVGDQGNMPAALSAAPANQLSVRPNYADPVGLLRLCDIYINPPRMGGGFSVAEAMAEGLAVVSFRDSDGGDKVGDEAVDSMDEYFSKLDLLVGSPSARQQQGRKLKARFDQHIDLARSAPSLLAACQLARERFFQRIGRIKNTDITPT